MKDEDAERVEDFESVIYQALENCDKFWASDKKAVFLGKFFLVAIYIGRVDGKKGWDQGEELQCF